ncbi:N-(5'-phosphoribosyl)anthranilate isomerase [Leuconostoc litchii]|uniref:N-(5'-phosphoribosyl)anthranilate isomerase n=1 Tax=Leuconostoc litchii TaxID=1981069 RepID=A0A6P2CPN5_9LACO|nr:phosphoribosylanthranilate isomerase [Leuconostoc litchii]TYC46931.1 phosphoribosylanthranilate isomerase [Leuconostoc litchii]GMA68834.1 N-(5'-phosphoribosyl)anthranilate isomerase [Leuconostoc litchii]
MTRIKLCGNFHLQDVDYLNEVKPDLAGIILVPNRRRSVTFELAKEMRDRLNIDIPLVGVFSNQKTSEILAYKNIIQVAQLHGQENEQQVYEIQNSGLPVIKVMKPNGQHQTCAIKRMIDAGAGTGKTFDWQGFKSNEPLDFLAGGLTTQNLQRAISLLNPKTVDISSGSEVNGIKNIEKMRELVRIARSNK